MTTSITGNTYPARDTLKAMGLKWNPTYKAWAIRAQLTSEQITQLSRFKGIIIETIEGQNVTEILDTRSYKQIYGRCEDAPCCGCCGNNYY